MDASLPRRPLLGIVTSGFDDRGLCVAAVREGSMAALAGVVAGDAVVAIDGRRVVDASSLRKALAPLGERATIETTRGSVTVNVQRRPELAGTAYGHIDSRGARLRTLVERPGGARGSAIFMQGISLASIEDSRPVESILRALPELVTLRLEKRGVGDSEGIAPDFDEEVEDFRAALATLPRPIFVIGHSVGGMIAPLLVDERVAGVVVIGTSSQRWLACLDDSARRQAALSGMDPDVAVRRQREEIEADRDERSRAFHQQLDAVDLRSAWSTVRCPVLVVHGEYDWVVSEEEGRAICEVAPNARFVKHPKIDHALTTHASLESSRIKFGRGEVDPTLGEAIAAFIRPLV